MSYLYKVIFDNGKPYTEFYNNDIDLKKGLSDFYQLDKENADAHIFNSSGEDISESQFISEIIGDILNTEEGF